MKSNTIIWGIAIILIIVAVFVTKNYNKNVSLPPQQNSNIQESESKKNSQSESFSDYINKPAIDFTLSDLDGNRVTLSSLKGKNVYVNFWATWCPPCRREMPDIERIYQQYKDKDLVILAVNIGEDYNTVKNFMNTNKYNFKALLDTDQSVAEKYKISSIPVSYFIDKNGNVKYKRVGAMTEEQINSYIKNLFTE